VVVIEDPHLLTQERINEKQKLDTHHLFLI